MRKKVNSRKLRKFQKFSGDFLYELEISEKCQQDVRKHIKNNKTLEGAFAKTIEKILENPEHFKPLRKPLQNMRRVHVLGSFVLVYEVKENIIRLIRFAHHDEAYR